MHTCTAFPARATHYFVPYYDLLCTDGIEWPPQISARLLPPHLLPFLPRPPPAISSAAINAILFFSAILHCRWQPFKDPVHNHIESLSVVLLFALYDTEMIVKITPGSNEKKMSIVLDYFEVTGMCLLVPFLIRDVRTRIVSILRKAPCCSKRKKRSRVSYGGGGGGGACGRCCWFGGGGGGRKSYGLVQGGKMSTELSSRLLDNGTLANMGNDTLSDRTLSSSGAFT